MIPILVCHDGNGTVSDHSATVFFQAAGAPEGPEVASPQPQRRGGRPWPEGSPHRRLRSPPPPPPPSAASCSAARLPPARWPATVTAALRLNAARRYLHRRSRIGSIGCITGRSLHRSVVPSADLTGGMRPTVVYYRNSTASILLHLITCQSRHMANDTDCEANDIDCLMKRKRNCTYISAI